MTTKKETPTPKETTAPPQKETPAPIKTERTTERTELSPPGSGANGNYGVTIRRVNN
jgi:hypothetical protein